MIERRMRVQGMVLVGCVKLKRDRRTEARDLCTSSLFKKRRRYAEECGQPWLIISAAHGLMHPLDYVGPYEQSLNTATERHQFEETAQAAALHLSKEGFTDVEIHAGAAYAEPLERHLQEYLINAWTPLTSLGIGHQMFWYNRHSRQLAEARGER